jgi:DNA adenine methylase
MDEHNQAMRKFFDTPVLRYLGAKWQLADWIIAQFPPHKIYVEPFAGSASVFFRKYPSQVEYLNDMDGNVVNFFRMLRERGNELIRAIELTPYSREEYELAFDPCDDPIERARRFYVACWQSFAATVIYKSGWRYQKTQLMRSTVPREFSRTDGLEVAIKRLKQAYIECRPAVEVIERLDSDETLFYVDPPYVKKSRSNGSRNRYTCEMTDEDHVMLAEVLCQARGMVILSGYKSELYDRLFAGWTVLEKSTTTNGNGQATEYLWLSPRTADLSVLPLFR